MAPDVTAQPVRPDLHLVKSARPCPCSGRTPRRGPRGRACRRPAGLAAHLEASVAIPLLSDHPHILEPCGQGCRFSPSSVPYYPQNASWANFAWIRAKTTRRKAPRIAFLGCRHTPVPRESAGVSADTRPQSRCRHLKRLWSCRSRRPPRSTRGGLRLFSTTRPGGPHRFKAIRPDLAELRQEVRAEIAALNSRIDSLDARFTSRIDALYQALFSHKDPAA